MRKLQQYANLICRAGNEQPRRLAPIPVSRDGRPGSGGWHPENWSWPTFSSFSSSFWSSLSCSVAGWQKLSSSWKQVEVAICVLILFNWLIGNSNKYQIQNQYQIDYQTKILRKQLTVVSPVDDTGDLNLLGEVTIWIHRHQGHHHRHHHNCQDHYKFDPQTSQLCIIIIITIIIIVIINLILRQANCASPLGGESPSSAPTKGENCHTTNNYSSMNNYNF